MKNREQKLLNYIRLAVATLGLIGTLSSIITYKVNPFEVLATFTYMSNFLIAFCLIAIALNDKNKKFLAIATTYISITMVIYHVLLGNGFANETWTSWITHTIVPLYAIIDFIFLSNVRPLKYKEIPKFLIFPIVYLIYTIILGAITGKYPYFFLDIQELGVPSFLMWFSILLVVFSATSFLTIFIINQKDALKAK